MAPEPVNGFNCTNECSGHGLNFHPEGLDCCLGAVLSIAALGAGEIPAGLQFSKSHAGKERVQFQKINKNLKTGAFFWLESAGLCLLMAFQSANTLSINLRIRGVVWRV